ncbi:hypothetical protein DFH09DRAFT_1302774 [Mycena vulgaris]|nr:hypothetical protein DFH09DRAFT_1302774 [Mycena vulgaris]
MDEEEGVLQFTEWRGLVTLGWIHTRPSQSCFMSSVDLHTQAHLQRMLPPSPSRSFFLNVPSALRSTLKYYPSV